LATTWHAAADATGPALTEHLPHLLARLLEHAQDCPPGASPGLIEGSAGVALTLHAIATGTTGGWTTCLLLD
jgi:lantibiotic biosynthesis protein